MKGVTSSEHLRLEQNKESTTVKKKKKKKKEKKKTGNNTRNSEPHSGANWV